MHDKEKRFPLQQDVCAQLEDTVIFKGLFQQIETFLHEVTILSHDAPSKTVISLLFPLNDCATVVEKGFLWNEDKNG